MSLDIVLATKHCGVTRVQAVTKILTPTELDQAIQGPEGQLLYCITA